MIGCRGLNSASCSLTWSWTLPSVTQTALDYARHQPGQTTRHLGLLADRIAYSHHEESFSLYFAPPSKASIRCHSFLKQLFATSWATCLQHNDSNCQSNRWWPKSSHQWSWPGCCGYFSMHLHQHAIVLNFLLHAVSWLLSSPSAAYRTQKTFRLSCQRFLLWSGKNHLNWPCLADSHQLFRHLSFSFWFILAL